MISAGSLAIDLGATALGGAPGAVVSTVGSSLLGNLTGAATDAARTAREQWTLQMAQQGSPLAAAIIVAAPNNVSGNEASGWRSVLTQVPASVMALANQQYPGGYWPVGQPDFYTDTNGATHRTIVAQVQAATTANGVGTGAPLSIPSSVTSTTGAITGTGVGSGVLLPTVTTTAPMNPSTSSSRTMLYVVLGLVVLVVVAVLLKHRGRK